MLTSAYDPFYNKEKRNVRNPLNLRCQSMGSEAPPFNKNNHESITDCSADNEGLRWECAWVYKYLLVQKNKDHKNCVSELVLSTPSLYGPIPPQSSGWIIFLVIFQYKEVSN